MKQNNIDKFLKKNSSTILTIVGAVGVGITALMSARDTIKMTKRLERESESKHRPLYTKEKIKVAAPCYIPTIITGVSTILCICGANKLNKDVQKSLTSAYVLLDQSYKEYKNSVKEIYGAEGNTKVVSNIARKHIEELDTSEQHDGDLFFDFFNLHYFHSTLDNVIEAEKAANEMLQMYGYVSLQTLYSLIGEETSHDMHGYDDSLGWSINAGQLYGYDRIKLDISKTTTTDGFEFYILDFADAPSDDYLLL